MMKFKAGDKVRITESSEHYETDFIYNPKDTDGEVTEIEKSFHSAYSVKVQWDNGTQNIYRELDLELVEPKGEFKIGHGAICIKKTCDHNVGDVELVSGIVTDGLQFKSKGVYFLKKCFTPCTNPPRSHCKERVAHALGANIELERTDGVWAKTTLPSFFDHYNYRVALPDPHAEKRAELKTEIERLRNELKYLGGNL